MSISILYCNYTLPRQEREGERTPDLRVKVSSGSLLCLISHSFGVPTSPILRYSSLFTHFSLLFLLIISITKPLSIKVIDFSLYIFCATHSNIILNHGFDTFIALADISIFGSDIIGSLPAKDWKRKMTLYILFWKKIII